MRKPDQWSTSQLLCCQHPTFLKVDNLSKIYSCYKFVTNLAEKRTDVTKLLPEPGDVELGSEKVEEELCLRSDVAVLDNGLAADSCFLVSADAGGGGVGGGSDIGDGGGGGGEGPHPPRSTYQTINTYLEM